MGNVGEWWETQKNQMDILKWKKYNIKINLLDGFNVRLDTETEKTSKLVGQNKISILKNKMEKDGQF